VRYNGAGTSEAIGEISRVYSFEILQNPWSGGVGCLAYRREPSRCSSTFIEGSTRLLQQLGEHYAEVIAAGRQLLRAVFQRWRGHEVDTQGDAFFVAFVRASGAISAAF
jgi:class 3 adenylate cyclase